MDVFEIAIEDLHPSQLSINREKLKSVIDHIKEFGFESLDPIIAREYCCCPWIRTARET